MLFVGVSLALIGPVSRGVEKICAQVSTGHVQVIWVGILTGPAPCLTSCSHFKSVFLEINLQRQILHNLGMKTKYCPLPSDSGRCELSYLSQNDMAVVQNL